MEDGAAVGRKGEERGREQAVRWPAGLGRRGFAEEQRGGRGEGREEGRRVREERRGAGSDRQIGFRVVMVIYTKHGASEPFNLIQWLKLMSF
jgi:hypothetical protein